jgi:hypothetical protein
VASLKLSPVLADTADLLGGQLRAHIRQLAEVVKPHAGRLDRKFVVGLRSQGFDPRQRKALATITAGAAVRILTAGRPLAYRPRKGSKLLYHDPAYLIATDPALEPRQIIEAYFQRWDIAVNSEKKRRFGALAKPRCARRHRSNRSPLSPSPLMLCC